MKQAKLMDDFQLENTLILVEAGTEVDIMPDRMGCPATCQTVRLSQSGLITNVPKDILRPRPA